MFALIYEIKISQLKTKTEHVNLQIINRCYLLLKKWQGMSATQTEMIAFQLKNNNTF